MESNRRDELDRILDEGLATYAARDPWPGLEDRVLRRLHQRSQSRKPAILRWAAVAACLLLVMTMFRSRHDRRPEPVITEPRREMATARPPEVRQPELRRTVSRAKPAPIPKRAQFPTPSPLTSEERALMELAVRAPQEAAALFSPTSQPAMTAIEIQPIQIEPLDSGSQTEDDIL